MTARRSTLAWFLLTSWVVGWHAELRAERLPLRAYTVADGLAHNDVNRIVRDSRGFLWFCTADGLSRFDSYAFANFGVDDGLPHASVNDLLETRAGEYWVATSGGLVRFDPNGRPGRDVVFERDAARLAPMFAVVLPDVENRRAHAINVLHEGGDGTIWAGTDSGLYRLEGPVGGRVLRRVEIGIPAEFPEQAEVADVVEDRHGTLWAAAPSGLYRRWPDGRTMRYTTRDGLPDNYLADLLETQAGELWVGTRLAGLFRVRADASRRAPVFDSRFSLPDLPSSWVFRLFETADHRVWIATARGLAEFLPPSPRDGPRFRAYATRNGLTDYGVTALAEDLGGNLWLGTGSVGAMKLARDGFTTFGHSDFIHTVEAIFGDQAGDICFRGLVLEGADAGAFDGDRIDALEAAEPVPHTRLGCFDGRRFAWFMPGVMTNFGWFNQYSTLQARNGDWWIGAREGLYRFPATAHLAGVAAATPRTRYTTADGLASQYTYRLFEDSRGRVWVSTFGPDTRGLARWDPGTGRMTDLAHAPGLPDLQDNLPRAFAEDRDGNIWIGFDQGLVKYREGFTYFTAAHGLPAGRVMATHLDRGGRLWLATERGGLVRVDDTGAPRPTFVSYTTAQGLTSNRADVIAEDARGYLYVGSGSGIDRFDPLTGRVRRYGVAEGLPSGMLLAAHADRRGVLWFGLSSGLARFVPAADRPSAPPATLIIGLRVAGVVQRVSALGEREMALADSAPNTGQVQIDFVALGFAPGEVLRYQYRLEDVDADWSAPGVERTVTFARLGPGRYRFAVRAVNADGLMDEIPATVAFAILRPIWQRWWFLSLAALGGCAAAAAWYRGRVARLLEVANLRTRIATDLHDDIGANLTRIALLSEVAQRTADGSQLVSISRIARESVSAMGDIVWAINPKRESLADLVRRMRQHADEVFTQRGIALRFFGPDDSDALKLGVDVRRDLLLIFKEVVSNTARHAACTRVAVVLRREGARLMLVVTDDGVGFDATAEHEGHGLASIRRRAERLKGTLAFAPATGGGTTVTLSIPA